MLRHREKLGFKPSNLLPVDSKPAEVLAETIRVVGAVLRTREASNNWRPASDIADDRSRLAFTWQLRGKSETRAAAYSEKRLTVVQEGWTLEKQLLVKRAILL